MGHAHVLLELVIVLGSAAVTTVLFQALRLPVALGYVLAGLLIGPHVPIPLVADAALVGVLSELGVILLMFTIGLELRVRTIARLGPPAAITALFEVGVMITLGSAVAGLLGMGGTEALFVGACVAISSTMLVAKGFEELGLRGGFTEQVFALLVFEDLIAILLLAILTAVAAGGGLSPGAIGMTLAKLGAFVAVLVIGGMLVVPRALRWIARRAQTETLLIGGLGLCFGLAVVADAFGYSVALGAFVAGMLAAESGRGHELQAMVRPFRDVFAAIFFVSIGMSIDPALVADNALAIAVLAIVVWIGKPLAISVGMFLAGAGLRPAVRSGLSLAQVGELSFVIAGVGIQSGVAGAYLLPIAVGVSCATALTTTWLIRGSDKIADKVAARLPRRIATFVSLYEAWLARLRAGAGSGRRLGRRLRRPLVIMLVDSAAFAAVLIAVVTIGPSLGATLVVRTGVSPAVATAVVAGVAAVLGALFLIGVIRRIGLVAHLLAAEVIPAATGLDLGRAPRRSFVLMLEIGLALAIGAPLAAVTQPFVPGGGIIVIAAIAALVIVTRRSMIDLDGHVRAGSALIVELLAQDPDPEHAHDPPKLDQAETLGLTGLATISLPEAAAAVGRSLAELDLRARTGATVLAIRRGEAGLPAPSPREVLQAGDVLALTGSDDAIAAARALLSSPDPAPAP